MLNPPQADHLSLVTYHLSLPKHYQLRHRTPGADVDICFGGRIAVTAVRLL